MTPVDNAEVAAAKEEEEKRKSFFPPSPVVVTIFVGTWYWLCITKTRDKVKAEQEAQQTPSCSLNQKSTERGGGRKKSRLCCAFFPRNYRAGTVGGRGGNLDLLIARRRGEALVSWILLSFISSLGGGLGGGNLVDSFCKAVSLSYTAEFVYLERASFPS